MQIQELNFLDLVALDDSCIVENGKPKLIKTVLKNGIMNIQLEKNYKFKNDFGNCLWDKYIQDTDGFSGFDSAGFKVQFYYSLVKLSDLASKNYKTVSYPIEDHDTYGFFKNKKSLIKEETFDPSRLNKEYFLNRWNPNKNIVYHLSDSFNKPKNKLFKEETYKAIDSINNSLLKAGLTMQIELKEPSGISPGDLRYSTIVLIDHPLANGLLGYGPSVSNPLTGEIVQAHTNMYSATIYSMTRRIWNNMQRFSKESKIVPPATPIAETTETKSDDDKSIDSLSQKLDSDLTLQAFKNQMDLTRNSKVSSFNTSILNKVEQVSNDRQRLIKGPISSNSAFSGHLSSEKQNVFEELVSKIEPVSKNDISSFKDLKSHDERLDFFAQNTAFHEDFLSTAHSVKEIIPGIKNDKSFFAEDGTSLRDWNSLSSTEQIKARDIIARYTYTSTFIHEIGHNLGLRHNFQGSFDKKNFFSEDELADHGLHAVPAYSSIMDYAFSEMNELNVFGKYDMAALRFAYQRQVEGVDGQMIDIKGPLYKLEEQLKAGDSQKDVFKEYLFCTDENAGLSTSCNRFDEGTSLVEITNHLIKRYDDSYFTRNFRDERDRFSAYNINNYTFRRVLDFIKIRNVFEDWKVYNNIFEGGENEFLMHTGCPEAWRSGASDFCEAVDDRNEAKDIAAKFFMRVLKTPDHLCAVQDTDGKKSSVSLLSIYEDIKFDLQNNHVPKSCFDEAIVAKLAEKQLSVLGEAGKFLNGFKDTNRKYKFVSDRYAIGTWPDKLAAASALFQRPQLTNTTTSGYKSLADIPFVQKEFQGFVNHMILGTKMTSPIAFKDKEGKDFSHEYSISTDLKINDLEYYFLGSLFNLPSSGNGRLVDAILSSPQLFGVVDEDSIYQKSASLLNNFTVRKEHIQNNFESEKREQLAINEDDSNEVKKDKILHNQEVAGQEISKFFSGDYYFFANAKNSLADLIIDSKKNSILLKSLNQETIKKVYDQRSQKVEITGLPELSDEEKAVKAVNDFNPDLTKALITELEAGNVLTKEVLLPIFEDEAFVDQIVIAVSLGVDGINAALIRINNIDTEIETKTSEILDLHFVKSNTPFKGASEDEKKLYTMRMDVLSAHLDGSIEKSLDTWLENIRLLPMHLNSSVK